MAKDKTRRWQMETKAFTAIWVNVMKDHKEEDAWKVFVLACFKRFSGRDEYSNMETLTEHDKTWKKWGEDSQYGYLNARCYAKCIGIKRTMMKKHAHEVSLPNGYLKRMGTKSGRVSSEDILNIFMGKTD
tara:strand:+ start:124 stop:513 length:390 start_codon:yes stop_codon:yes gene_type:complete